MKIILHLLTLCLLFTACQQRDITPYRLDGAWTLRHVEHPVGTAYDFSLDDEGTYCSIYDGDSMLHVCRMAKTSSGLVITPDERHSVTFIDKGGSEHLYMEDDDPHPLTFESDTIMTIQNHGVLFTWVRADDIFREWGDELRQLLANDTVQQDSAPNRYVLSAKERQQERTIQGFNYLIIIVILLALFAIHLALSNRRARQRLQLQLKQIQEVNENRAPTVKQAVETVENAYFASDDYAALQKRMSSGQTLKPDDWDNLEQQLKTVYPGFTSQLRGLRSLSELEYQVCLLIKLRIPPKDIAAVLARDASTISTVRSRLYAKVFGTKGGAKAWDDFILGMAR